MRCDCTAEPPGELIDRATAFGLPIAKARSSARAMPAKVSPGLSGVEKPITPVSRTTGTVGRPRQRFGIAGRTRSRPRAQRAHFRLGRPGEPEELVTAQHKQ